MKRNDKTLQKYEYEDPYESTQEVKVEANGETVVNFDLALRQAFTYHNPSRAHHSIWFTPTPPRAPPATLI